MAKGWRSNRAFTLIEGLVASFIMVVAIVGMFAAWSTGFKQSKKISEVTASAEIAQAELETARVWGPDNLPTGTYNSSTQQGTWTGAYIPATGWTTSGTAYYNFSGTQLSSSTSTGVYFSVTMTITDSGVLPGSGTSYTLAPTSLRNVVVSVTNVSTGVVDFQMATSFIENGV